MEGLLLDEAPWLGEDRCHWNITVREWLEEVANRRSMGSIEVIEEVRVRPWSTVLRIRFGQMITYFKANRLGSTFEGPVLTLLARHWPEHTPPILGMDNAHSWILMKDAGESLLDADPPLQIAELTLVLSQYAEMQKGLLSSLDELIVLGVPDRRLQRLPLLLEELLEGEDLRFGRSTQEAASLCSSIRRSMAALRAVCGVLSHSSYSLTLDHGDIHVGNITKDRDRRLRLCDWGDACLTHPFCSICVAIEGVLLTVPEQERKNIESQLWAAYLKPWTDLASPATLQAEVAWANWVTPVLRALDLAYMFKGMDQESCQLWKPLIGRCLERWPSMPEPLLRTLNKHGWP